MGDKWKIACRCRLSANTLGSRKSGAKTGENRNHVSDYDEQQDQDNVDSGIQFCSNDYLVGGTNVKTQGVL